MSDDCGAVNASEIDRAVTILRRGGLVALPTETVYGLGADARNPSAVERIFAAKGRPANHPLIVHVANATHARRYAATWPESAEMLARVFWPGPLTLILPRGNEIASAATAGAPTVGLRVPNHPLALALLEAFEGPIAAPSANRWTRVSPTTAQHVRDDLGDRVELILDGGPCQVGIESTVLSLAGERPMLLRPGAVSRMQIEAMLGPVDTLQAPPASHEIAPSPGLHPQHYAPAAPTWRVESQERGQIERWCAAHGGEPAVLLVMGDGVRVYSARHIVIRMPRDARDYAQVIYQVLHQADARRPVAIWIEMPPAEAAWAAVRDRLMRAARDGGTIASDATASAPAGRR